MKDWIDAMTTQQMRDAIASIHAAQDPNRRPSNQYTDARLRDLESELALRNVQLQARENAFAGEPHMRAQREMMEQGLDPRKFRKALHPINAPFRPQADPTTGLGPNQQGLPYSVKRPELPYVGGTLPPLEPEPQPQARNLDRETLDSRMQDWMSGRTTKEARQAQMDTEDLMRGAAMKQRAERQANDPAQNFNRQWMANPGRMQAEEALKALLGTNPYQHMSNNPRARNAMREENPGLYQALVQKEMLAGGGAPGAPAGGGLDAAMGQAFPANPYAAIARDQLAGQAFGNPGMAEQLRKDRMAAADLAMQKYGIDERSTADMRRHYFDQLDRYRESRVETKMQFPHFTEQQIDEYLADLEVYRPDPTRSGLPADLGGPPAPKPPSSRELIDSISVPGLSQMQPGDRLPGAEQGSAVSKDTFVKLNKAAYDASRSGGVEEFVEKHLDQLQRMSDRQLTDAMRHFDRDRLDEVLNRYLWTDDERFTNTSKLRDIARRLKLRVAPFAPGLEDYNPAFRSTFGSNRPTR